MKYRTWKVLALLCILTGVTWSGYLEECYAAESKIADTSVVERTDKKLPYTQADKARYDTLRKENAGHLAPKERFITTTAPDIILTFGGLTRRESVDDMLDYLDAIGSKATFFVTEMELRKHHDTVAEIQRRGHEIGLGLRTGTDGDFYETCAQIERMQKKMKKQLGIQPTIARQVFGIEVPSVNEACSAMGVRLLGQSISMVQSKDKEAKTAEAVFVHIFGSKITSMGRGQIIYGRLDFLDEPRLTGQILELIKMHKIDNIAYRQLFDAPETNPRNDSAYGITSVGAVLADVSHQWNYPVPEEQVLPSLRVKEHYAIDVDKNFEREFHRRYIGAPDVYDKRRAQGFTAMELKYMDHGGFVKGVETPTVFLTFDDWSNDRSINQLLYVLRKHHVKGTFFIITMNVKHNPNLLRAIAEEGHTIGSHTHSHRSMAFRSGKVAPMTKKEYEEDVKKAYVELTKAVGDVMVDGKPMLTRFIRPPTLAISKDGVQSIFRAGYTFIVSGYESTEDYAAPSRQTMVGAIQHGIYDEKGQVRKGCIIVMHMTDAAKYTAEALDEILTTNEARDDADPRKFQVGQLTDYLTESYDQMAPVRGSYEAHLDYEEDCC